MPRYFPRQTIEWKIEEPSAVRKLTLNVVEMGVLTGIVVRLVRALALGSTASGGWLFLGGMFLLMYAFLFGMVTLHLGNYPIRRWLWRAPAFAAMEAAAEMLTSYALITLGREPYGTARAVAADWPELALDTLLYRFAGILVFATLLAGVVQVMRYALLRREHRDHTADAIREDYERRM